MTDNNPNVSMLIGEIDDNSVQNQIEWILERNIGRTHSVPLTMFIKSMGGDVSAAFALIEIMNGSSRPIRTVALGEIGSAALIIFMSGTKGQRIITPTCSVMSHNFNTEFEGTYHDFLNVQREFEFVNQRIINQYVTCTGLSEEKVKKELVSARDTWLTPQETVDYGIADKMQGLSSTLTG